LVLFELLDVGDVEGDAGALLAVPRDDVAYGPTLDVPPQRYYRHVQLAGRFLHRQ
jgi:hypothetical protein